MILTAQLVPRVIVLLATLNLCFASSSQGEQDEEMEINNIDSTMAVGSDEPGHSQGQGSSSIPSEGYLTVNPSTLEKVHPEPLPCNDEEPFSFDFIHVKVADDLRTAQVVQIGSLAEDGDFSRRTAVESHAATFTKDKATGKVRVHCEEDAKVELLRMIDTICDPKAEAETVKKLVRDKMVDKDEDFLWVPMNEDIVIVVLPAPKLPVSVKLFLNNWEWTIDNYMKMLREVDPEYQTAVNVFKVVQRQEDISQLFNESSCDPIDTKELDSSYNENTAGHAKQEAEDHDDCPGDQKI